MADRTHASRGSASRVDRPDRRRHDMVAATPDRALARPNTSGALLPGALGREQVAWLQRTIGNQALGRWLAASDRPRLPAVQRYPDTILSTPFTAWRAATRRARGSEGGVSGGVYFLDGADTDPVTQVVVKPIFPNQQGAPGTEHGEMEATQLGDTLIAGLGIDVGRSRVMPKSSPEFDEIFASISAAEAEKKRDYIEHGGPAKDRDDRAVIAEFTDIATLAIGFKVMESVRGPSLKSLTEGSRPPDRPTKVVTGVDVSRLTRILNDPAFGRDLGALMVADALLGNRDRLNENANNLGNILVREGTTRLVAIDTSAELYRVVRSQTDVWKWRSLLEGVGDPAKIEAVIAKLVAAIRDEIGQAPQEPVNLNGAALFLASLNLRGLVQSVHRGVKDAIQRAYIDLLLSGVLRTTLETEANRQYGTVRSEKTSYERLMANAAYLHAYAAGVAAALTPGEAGEMAQTFWSTTVEWARGFPEPETTATTTTATTTRLTTATTATTTTTATTATTGTMPTGPPHGV
jgi:hypothetical protein